jgi:formate hydrogenlyase subunit 4
MMVMTMLMEALNYILFALCIFVLPFITLGIIRKVKARMQGRVGARISQPLFDVLKMLAKGQTVSETTTWIFQLSAALNCATILLIACLVPWLSFKPNFPGDDLFLFLYLLALLRFTTILSAMDTGSSFGAFGASREAYLSMLVEPAMFISLAAPGLVAHTSSLSAIFDFSRSCTIFDAPVWLAAAVGLYLTSLVDLSRMPIDDPTTHLELTMVHEAMILENSGKNLALVEFSHLVKMVVLFGLTLQCLLHAATIGNIYVYEPYSWGFISIAGILGMALVTGLVESLSVKLQWRRTPEFIAYALTMSFFAIAGALIGGSNARHGL